MQGDFQVGEWRVSPSLNTISGGDTATRVEPKVMQVLVCLARHEGVVSKDQLIAEVWPDTFVSDDVLPGAVSALRKAFQDNARSPRVIETIHKSGYRLLPAVDWSGNGNGARNVGPAVSVAEPISTASSADPAHTSGARRAKILRRVVIALVVVVALAEASFWLFWTRRPQLDSIAVLPLVNTAQDPGSDYLSDGISEAVTNDLSEIPGLRVTAWTTASRYRNAGSDLQQLGKQLGVKAVLTGRLLQQGGRLVVQAELVNVRDCSHLWGGQYDRPMSDLIAVQQQLSQDIASGLRVQLSGAQQQEIARRNAANPQAYELYLKGRFFWNRRSKEGLDKALDYFQQAIAADPNYALAYAGIADCYNLMDDWGSTPPQQTFPKARAAALKALQLDDSLAEAHTSLAMVHESFDWDWPATEQEFQRALQLNPNYATARQWYAMFLVAQKRYPEADAQIQQAAQLDPLSPIITMAVGEVYNWEGKYDPAIAQYKKALELNPDFAGAWGNLSYVYAHAGRYDEALQALVKSYELSHQERLVPAIRQAYARGGYPEVWRVELGDESRRRAAGEFIDSASLASYYALLGQTQPAMEWLRRAYDEHSSSMVFLSVNQELAPLHGKPEFERLLDTLHLPQ